MSNAIRSESDGLRPGALAEATIAGQASAATAGTGAEAAVGRAPFALLAAVFLVAASGLLFELVLTRIFSATIWYHFAFVAISVALFGWGLGGFVVHLLRLAKFERQAPAMLVGLAVLLTALVPLFPYGIIQRPFTPDLMVYYFGLGLLPFLAGGALLSLAFEVRGADANRMYFADLSGAAVGVLLVPVVLSVFGAETAALATAILPALAAVLLSRLVERGRAFWTALALAALAGSVGLTAWNYFSGVLSIRDAPQKGLYKLLHASPGARIDSDRWNAYSRISSLTGFDDFHLARLFIDSDAWTNIQPFDGNPASVAERASWFRAFPFRITAEPEVMVIGPGGGSDVVLALAAGSPKVTAVEMNPLIIDAVRRWGSQAGNLYDHPRVELVMSEGRNFIERADRRFDVIMLGFVDSWASVASGGLSLSENYLYTSEAIEAYYEHLSDDGALAIVRWPVDVRRLVANSYAVLKRRGLSDEEIRSRILAVSQDDRPATGEDQPETVYLLTRSPLTPERIAALLRGHEGAHVLVSPDGRGEETYRKLLQGEISLETYAESFDTLATPVFDNRPFYFATDKRQPDDPAYMEYLPGIPRFMVSRFSKPLLSVLGIAVLLLLLGGLAGMRVPGPRTAAYFGALGLGFIICEIALMQRLILLLGHPIYTLIVILFTILLASSLGSLYSRRFAADRIGRRLAVVLPLVVALVVVAAFGLPVVVRALLPLELGPRILLAGLIVFPFGFLMGMPFPLGLRHQAQTPNGASVSSLWGVNGIASVVGSIAAVALAVMFGFTAVFLVGAGCYVLAFLTRPR